MTDEIPPDIRAAAAAAGSNARVALFELSTGAAKLWGTPGAIEALNRHFAHAIMAERARSQPIPEGGEK